METGREAFLRRYAVKPAEPDNLGGGGSKTSTQKRRIRRRELWERSGGRCFWCGIVTVEDGQDAFRHDSSTLEHVIDGALGGGDNWRNLVLACHQCNWLRSGSHVCVIPRRFVRLHPEFLRHLRVFGITYSQNDRSREKEVLSLLGMYC